MSVPAPLAFHPGSGSERKNWPEAHWAVLLETLSRETPHRFLLVGGEAEGDRLTRLARRLPPDRIRLMSGQPLPALARALGGCRVFVGHDSGITHLAAALGVPTLVLWGPTVAGVWAPRGAHVQLLPAGDAGLGALDPATVRAALGGL